jgi:hypothetical protein
VRLFYAGVTPVNSLGMPVWAKINAFLFALEGQNIGNQGYSPWK